MTTPCPSFRTLHWYPCSWDKTQTPCAGLMCPLPMAWASPQCPYPLTPFQPNWPSSLPGHPHPTLCPSSPLPWSALLLPLNLPYPQLVTNSLSSFRFYPKCHFLWSFSLACISHLPLFFSLAYISPFVVVYFSSHTEFPRQRTTSRGQSLYLFGSLVLHIQHLAQCWFIVGA